MDMPFSYVLMNMSDTNNILSLKISLIAPIYGVENYIVKFAESVLGQSYANIEYIFVNDGTKDHSIEILESLIKEKFPYRSSQIKIVHKQNEGLPAARRSGLEHATGDYVYNVDSDDWLEVDAIAKIVERIKATDADIVYFNYIKEYPSRSKKKKELEYSNDERNLYIRNMYNHKSSASVWNKCVRRSLFVNNDICIPRHGYAEDCVVTSQLVGYARSIAYLDAYLYHYRKGNPGALTAQKMRNRKREYAINFLNLYERYHEVPEKRNPIAPIMDDIIIQAGWYSILFNLNLFVTYPYLATYICDAKMHAGSNVFVVAQWITKIYAMLYR